MEAIINISKEIEGGDLISVVSQFRKYEEPTSLLVNISSVGGLVTEGNAIYNYLKSLNLPITTYAKDVCASIATKIFLAGDVRKVERGIDFLIHNPFLQNITGDAHVLESASKYVKEREIELNKFYAKTLNLPIEAIEPLTSNETFLNEEQLISLGFATEIIETEKTAKHTYKAVAKINLNQNQMNETKEVKSMLQELTESFKSFAKGFKAKNVLEISDANGNMLVFPDLEPDQEVSVGDAVSSPDETYTMEDGTQIVVLEGAVSEIIKVDEMAEVMEENAKLKAELEELKASSEKKDEALAKFSKDLDKVKAMVGDYNPQAKKRDTVKQVKGFVYEAGKISNLKK